MGVFRCHAREGLPTDRACMQPLRLPASLAGRRTCVPRGIDRPLRPPVLRIASPPIPAGPPRRRYLRPAAPVPVRGNHGRPLDSRGICNLCRAGRPTRLCESISHGLCYCPSHFAPETPTVAAAAHSRRAPRFPAGNYRSQSCSQRGGTARGRQCLSSRSTGLALRRADDNGRQRRAETPSLGLASQRRPHNRPRSLLGALHWHPLPRSTLFFTDPPTGLPGCEPTDVLPDTAVCAGGWREGQHMRQPTLPGTHRGVGRVRFRSPVCVCVCVCVCACVL